MIILKKYLGNKSKIIDIIYNNIFNMIGPNEKTIFDAFAGTTNVGRYFKERGFSVISNDINDVSYILGKAYLEANEIPTFETLINSDIVSARKFSKLRTTEAFKESKNLLTRLNNNTNDSNYLKEIMNTAYMDIIVYLTYYSSEEDFINITDNTQYKIKNKDFIYRNYCKLGSNSEYINLVTNKSLKSTTRKLKSIKSKVISNFNNDLITQSLLDSIDDICKLFEAFEIKPYDINNFDKGLHILESLVKNNYFREFDKMGSELNTILEKLTKLRLRDNHIGNRMFFSHEHGIRIDIILNTILYWLKNNFINKVEHNILLTSLLESVALFSNTSATYQAFYKDYRDNTLQPFRLVVPEVISSDKRHYIYKEDTFELIKNITLDYDILYLDPPYNWRIYDSNYHLLNFIAKYHSIDNLEAYEQGILGASGENRFIEREYTNFNRRETFEQYLFEPIRNAKCKYIAISYSNSDSNHNKKSDLSIKNISDFLSDEKLFEKNTFRIVEIDSIKFESRKSEKKENIKELLFLAKKIM